MIDQQERLYSVNLGRVILISLNPIHYTKVNGVGVLIDTDVTPILKKKLITKIGVDVAQELNMSTNLVSRLKRGLGIPLIPRAGTSRTTAWRRKKA